MYVFFISRLLLPFYKSIKQDAISFRVISYEIIVLIIYYSILSNLYMSLRELLTD